MSCWAGRVEPEEVAATGRVPGFGRSVLHHRPGLPRGWRLRVEPMSDYDRLLELIRARRSIRRFSDRAVDRDDIARLLEAARWAPSNHNRQPWRFLVIEDKPQINQLAETVGQSLSEKLKSLPEAAAAYAGEFTHYATFFAEAPVLLVVLHKQPVSVSAAAFGRTKKSGPGFGRTVERGDGGAEPFAGGTGSGAGNLCADRAVAGPGCPGRGVGFARRSRPHLPGGGGTSGGIAGAAAEENHRTNRRVQEQSLTNEGLK